MSTCLFFDSISQFPCTSVHFKNEEFLLHIYARRSLISIIVTIIRYFLQQIAHLVTNDRLSLLFLLAVSKSTRSSSWRYTQKYTSTANSVKDASVYTQNTIF